MQKIVILVNTLITKCLFDRMLTCSCALVKVQKNKEKAGIDFVCITFLFTACPKLFLLSVFCDVPCFITADFPSCSIYLVISRLFSFVSSQCIHVYSLETQVQVVGKHLQQTPPGTWSCRWNTDPLHAAGKTSC